MGEQKSKKITKPDAEDGIPGYWQIPVILIMDGNSIWKEKGLAPRPTKG